MIRTSSVSLTTLPSAIAYRRKGTAGGSAIVIVRSDATQPGIATISKTSGEPILSKNTSADLYPVDAFQEAIKATAGMPYHKKGAPSAPEAVVAKAEEELADADAAEATEVEEKVEFVIDTAEYLRLLDTYTTKDGKFSFDLMNKDMIQLAHKSEVVARMVAEGEDENVIVSYIVGAKFRNATGNKNLTDAEVAAMAELIDGVSPKGAFKELRAKVRQMLSEAKRA